MSAVVEFLAICLVWLAFLGLLFVVASLRDHAPSCTPAPHLSTTPYCPEETR